MAYQICRVVVVPPQIVGGEFVTVVPDEEIDSRTASPFSKRFFQCGGILYALAQDIGPPWPSLAMAAKKMAELRLRLGCEFEIRVFEETEVIRQSWIRKGLLPPEQPAKQEALVNRLGPNRNKFLPPNVGDGSTGTADSALESLKNATPMWGGNLIHTKDEIAKSLIEQALKDRADAGIRADD